MTEETTVELTEEQAAKAAEDKEIADFQKLAGVSEAKTPATEPVVTTEEPPKVPEGIVLSRRQRTCLEYLYPNGFSEEQKVAAIETGMIDKVAGLRKEHSQYGQQIEELKAKAQATTTAATPAVEEDEFGFDTEEADKPESEALKKIAVLEEQIATLTQKNDQDAVVQGSARSFFEEIASKGITEYGAGDSFTDAQKEARQELFATGQRIKEAVPNTELSDTDVMYQALQLLEPALYKASVKGKTDQTKAILASQAPVATTFAPQELPAEGDLTFEEKFAQLTAKL